MSPCTKERFVRKHGCQKYVCTGFSPYQKYSFGQYDFGHDSGKDHTLICSAKCKDFEFL